MNDNSNVKINVFISVCHTCGKLLKCGVIVAIDNKVVDEKCCCGQGECKAACTRNLKELSHGYCSKCHVKEEEKRKKWIRKRLLLFLDNLLIKKRRD